MKRRTVFAWAVLTAASLAAASSPWLRPARADHRLTPAAHRLDVATEALLTELIESAHHQDDREHEANDELLAVMASGAIYGQARALHELIESGNAESDLRSAARELDRQMRLSERRVLHAHVTRDVRQRLRDVQDAMIELRGELGDRSSFRRFDH